MDELKELLRSKVEVRHVLIALAVLAALVLIFKTAMSGAVTDADGDQCFPEFLNGDNQCVYPTDDPGMP